MGLLMKSMGSGHDVRAEEDHPSVMLRAFVGGFPNPSTINPLPSLPASLRPKGMSTEAATLKTPVQQRPSGLRAAPPA